MKAIRKPSAILMEEAKLGLNPRRLKAMREGRYGFGAGQIAPKGVELEVSRLLTDKEMPYKEELDTLVNKRAAGTEFVPILQAAIVDLKTEGAKNYLTNRLIPQIGKLPRGRAGLFLWNSIMAGKGERVVC